MSASEPRLTVAVTGPTGTFGFGLMPLLQSDERIARVVGIARRPFDPSEHGWSKMEYRRGDVRDPDALRDAFDGADVVVHLAFMITGAASWQTIRAISVAGTVNAFRAAAVAGARRFVYASSVAACGFRSDNPIGMREDWPVRPAARLFYTQEKAELEQLLGEEAELSPRLALYLLRPPIVLGPHAVGAKAALPGPLAAVGRTMLDFVNRLPCVSQRSHRMFRCSSSTRTTSVRHCSSTWSPPGLQARINIAGEGVLTGADVVRELGLAPVSIPARLIHAAARAAASMPRLPFAPPAAEWLEAASHPAIMDTTKARHELGWRPKYSALQALRATLRSQGGADGE